MNVRRSVAHLFPALLMVAACATRTEVGSNVAAAPMPVPPGTPSVLQSRAIPAAEGYRLAGDTTLWPSALSDDGDKTYITWDITQPLPAVFGLTDTDQEEMVDSYMRSDVLVIDRVYSNLVFRIDKAVATARRLPPVRSARQ